MYALVDPAIFNIDVSDKPSQTLLCRISLYIFIPWIYIFFTLILKDSTRTICCKFDLNFIPITISKCKSSNCACNARNFFSICVVQVAYSLILHEYLHSSSHVNEFINILFIISSNGKPACNVHFLYNMQSQVQLTPID